MALKSSCNFICLRNLRQMLDFPEKAWRLNAVLCAFSNYS